jgi:hypothetical protein
VARKAGFGNRQTYRQAKKVVAERDAAIEEYQRKHGRQEGTG